MLQRCLRPALPLHRARLLIVHAGEMQRPLSRFGRPFSTSFIAKAAQSGAKSLLGAFPSFQGRFDEVLKGIHIDKLDETGDVQVSFTVAEHHANGYGTLHGGFIATLVDVVGTLSLIGKDKDKAGVSVDLNVTYMAAANIGDRVVCKGTLLRIGNSLGFTQVDVVRESDKKLLATGRHTKAFPSKGKKQ